MSENDISLRALEPSDIKILLEIENNTLGGNDFGMMEEVIKRRFRKCNSNVSTYNLPDLILIDGGRGHLNTVYKVLKEYQLDLSLIHI